MTQEEIIQHLHELLDLHLKLIRGYVGQEPYKGNFFRLFMEAYRNGYFERSSRPLLTGDALRVIIQARWLTGDKARDEEKLSLMEQLLLKWDEWRYALDHSRSE